MNKLNEDDEVFKLSPWNENNRLITENDIYYIYEKCGFKNVKKTIKINDISLYQTAFVHSSYVTKTQEEHMKNSDKKIELTPRPENALPLFTEDYEDMEFLGDRCLDLSIAFYLYRMYPHTYTYCILPYLDFIYIRDIIPIESIDRTCNKKLPKL